jgi:hypothetical protein
MSDHLTIRISPTFHGIGVAVEGGPSSKDPLGQGYVRELFPTIDEAVDALPRLARLELVRRGEAKADSPGGTA